MYIKSQGTTDEACLQFCIYIYNPKYICNSRFKISGNHLWSVHSSWQWEWRSLVCHWGFETVSICISAIEWLRPWPPWHLDHPGWRERRGCEEHLGGLRPRLPPGGIDVMASCSPLKNPKTKKMHNLQTETFTSLQNNKSLKSQQYTTFFALITISSVVWPKV